VLAQQTVGTAGGTVTTSDGALAIRIPAGALAGNTTITVQSASAQAAGAIGTVYEIGPTGTQFASPVTLSFQYAGVDLQGHDPASLEVATIVSGNWVALAGGSVDTSAHSVAGATTHLSPYGLIVASTTDAGASNDAAPSDDATTGPDSGVLACGGEGSMTGSCQNPPQPLCSHTPGSYVASCTNNPGGGYSATCCPGDAGVSDDAGPGGHGADGGVLACGGEGSMTGSCQNPPQPLCSHMPGSYVASCMNNPLGGYSATCCPGDGGAGGADAGQGGPACGADGSSTGSCQNPPQPLCSHSPGTYVASCMNMPSAGYIARCCPSTDASTD
jgi:hypothetical protein